MAKNEHGERASERELLLTEIISVAREGEERVRSREREEGSEREEEMKTKKEKRMRERGREREEGSEEDFPPPASLATEAISVARRREER